MLFYLFSGIYDFQVTHLVNIIVGTLRILKIINSLSNICATSHFKINQHPFLSQPIANYFHNIPIFASISDLW